MFTPWFDIDSTFGEMDLARRQMEQLLQQALAGQSDRGLSWGNLKEEQDTWVLTADCPGLKAGDLTLTVHPRELRLSGERKSDAPEGYTPRRLERRPWKFDRTISLPDSIDADKITADLADGVLTVRMAKRPEVQPRTISVGAN